MQLAPTPLDRLVDQPGRPYEEVAEQARAVLAQVRATERLEALLKKLEARAKIEIFL